VFCSGNAVTADGRLFIVGVTMAVCLTPTGPYILDPSQPEGERWAAAGLVETWPQYRWYPTSTLSTTAVCSLSQGIKFQQLITFGGTTGTPETTSNALDVVPKTAQVEDGSDHIAGGQLGPQPRYNPTILYGQGVTRLARGPRASYEAGDRSRIDCRMLTTVSGVAGLGGRVVRQAMWSDPSST